MSKTNKEFVENAFDEYRFKCKTLKTLKAELERIDNLINIKTSAINNDSSSGKRKDIADRYNEMIEKKLRLENRIINFEGYIATVNNVLGLLNSDHPIKYTALKLKHIECRTISQIEKELSYSRSKCFGVLKEAEKEFKHLMELVS